jgi:hypothetical protein
MPASKIVLAMRFSSIDDMCPMLSGYLCTHAGMSHGVAQHEKYNSRIAMSQYSLA